MITDFRLKVFAVAAQTLSFTKTANILAVSQPSITKHIKELERELGNALFLRNGNKIKLTPYGIEILSYAREVLKSYDRLNEYIKSKDVNFDGRITIGASTTLSQYILPPILAKFQERYPKITVKLISGNSEEIVSGVISEEIDFGLVEDNKTNHSIHYEQFKEDEIILVTAADNHYNEIDISQITEIPLIIREDGSGTLAVIERYLNLHKIYRKDLNIRMQLGSSESIIRYILSSDSYAFISIAAAYDYLKQNKLKIVDIEDINITRSFRFISLHGKSSRLIKIFKNFCLHF